MCIQYNKVHIINTYIKSIEDSTKKFKTYFHCGRQQYINFTAHHAYIQ